MYTILAADLDCKGQIRTKMHLVIVHGYLLRGTGSNIYSANIAKTWKNQGHSVTVLCQDHKADSLEFVDECFIGTSNIPTKAPAAGFIRVIVPDIDKLLLVYVYNCYEGFQVKEMGNVECSLSEIENHITLTAAGLRKVLEQGVDHVLANHALLSPVITKRACEGSSVPFDVKIHGSAVNFSLKQRPELVKYAIEGLSHCEKIIAGTAYICRLLDATFELRKEEIGLRSKTVIIPPGMDPNVFKLFDKNTADNLQRFREKIKKFILRKPEGRDAYKIELPVNPSSDKNLHVTLTALAGSYDQWAVDSDLIKRLPDIAKDEPIIIYFGAYLNTKGVGEIIASFPTVLQAIPKARLIVVGYGGYREHIEGMLRSMETGDVEAFIAFCQAGKFLDASSEQLHSTFRKLSPDERNRITVTGILDHDQLCEILSMASVAVVASKCAEAFGMVVVESMSSGVLPICNYHSGVADVLDVVKNAEPELEELMHMTPRPGQIFELVDGSFMQLELPARIISALQLLYPNGQFEDYSRRKEVAQKLRKIAVENFSWTKICKSLLDPLLPAK